MSKENKTLGEILQGVGMEEDDVIWEITGTAAETASKSFSNMATAFEALSAKYDGGKLRLSLVPRGIVEAIAQIREYGSKKYKDPENWKKVDNGRYWEAALRHMEAARNDMWSKDEESGFPHIWHVACNLAFIIARDGQ